MNKKGVDHKENSRQSLSSEQREILTMLTEDYETPKNIAVRRRTSKQAVYKTIAKLRKKGYLTRGYTRGLKKRRTTHTLKPPKGLKKGVRLHGQEFNCKLIHRSRYYDELKGKRNLIYVDDNTVTLHRESIRVFCSPHRSFLADSEERAFALSLQYWNSIFSQLENRLKVIFVKGEATRVKQCNHHFANINSEVAERYNRQKKKVKLYTREDGKLWFLFDYSKSVHEDECLHSETALDDRGKVNKQLNDWRDNDPPTLSEISGLVMRNAESMAYFGDNLKSHVEAIQTLSASVKHLNRLVEALRGRNEPV